MAKRHWVDRLRARQQGLETDGDLDQWVTYGSARMFVVGYTPGGAPYGWVEGTDGTWLDEDQDHRQPEEQFIEPPF